MGHDKSNRDLTEAEVEGAFGAATEVMEEVMEAVTEVTGEAVVVEDVDEDAVAEAADGDSTLSYHDSAPALRVHL